MTSYEFGVKIEEIITTMRRECLEVRAYAYGLSKLFDKIEYFNNEDVTAEKLEPILASLNMMRENINDVMHGVRDIGERINKDQYHINVPKDDKN